MPVTYRKIASVTVGSGGAADIQFTGIPSIFDDLVLKLSLRTTSTNADVKITFNSNTSSYSRRAVSGSGTAATSAGAADAWIGQAVESTYTAATFSNVEIYIPNYKENTNKPYSVDQTQENNATLSYMNLIAGLWSNTAAITSITFNALSGSFTFAQHSTATLYGISKS